LSALEGARLCVVSERKQTHAFDGEKLKPLKEQEGCRIPARKLFQQPSAFSMTAAMIALSNSQLEIVNGEDGLERRLALDPMPHKMVPAHKLVDGCPTHWRAMDESIKTNARDGVFASEMTFVMLSLYETLFIRDGTQISPVPLALQRELDEVFSTSKPKDPMKQWLNDNCVSVRYASQATPMSELNERIRNDEALGIGNVKGVWNALREIGVSKSSNGRGLNCYKFQLDTDTEPKPLKLKDLPQAAAPIGPDAT
jgi:phage/plasmid-associated DNA primase